ncbi:MAG: CsgG/HfaB family protein [Treponema sp.]|nr:CsgG/HfaB family protein [Treponema sp.]
MKRFIVLLALLALLSAELFAQETALPRLAVVEFAVNDNTAKIKRDAITVREVAESEMVKTGKYEIITREDIDKLIANQRIQVSSISSAENLKKLQLQNISYIVTGSLNANENDYVITIRILDVSTGRYSHSDNDFINSGSRELFNGITNLMKKFNSGMSADEGGAIVQGTGRTYKIGDTGPAGGIIFYDKGVFSGGWRYLEVAPLETEFRAQWGAYQHDVAGTSTAVGSGKRNTQLIVEYLKSKGENRRAAQLCTSLDFDSIKDWFLPSKDELDLMYRNLKAKGLGNFVTRGDTTNLTFIYWSSSQSDSGSSWLQSFLNGNQLNYDKEITVSVRAIRAF